MSKRMPPLEVVEISSDEHDADCVIVKVLPSPSKHRNKIAKGKYQTSSSTRQQIGLDNKSRQRTDAGDEQIPGNYQGKPTGEQPLKPRNGEMMVRNIDGNVDKSPNVKKEAAAAYIRSTKPAIDAKQSAKMIRDVKVPVDQMASPSTGQDVKGQQQTYPVPVQNQTSSNQSRVDDSPTLENTSPRARSRSCSTATLVACSPGYSRGGDSPRDNLRRETAEKPGIAGGLDAQVLNAAVSHTNENEAPAPKRRCSGATKAQTQVDSKELQGPLPRHGALTQTHPAADTDSRSRTAIRLDNEDRSQDMKPGVSMNLLVPQRSGSTRERAQPPNQQARPQPQMLKKPPGWSPRFNFEAFAAVPLLFTANKKPLHVLAEEAMNNAEPTAQSIPQSRPVGLTRWRQSRCRKSRLTLSERTAVYRRGYRPPYNTRSQTNEPTN